jgi:hypothetical protein
MKSFHWRFLFSAGLLTLLFGSGTTALHAQMRPRPPMMMGPQTQSHSFMTPFNMGMGIMGMGIRSGQNMLTTPFPAFGGMINGAGYGGGGYGGAMGGGYGGGGYGGGGYGNQRSGDDYGNSMQSYQDYYGSSGSRSATKEPVRNDLLSAMGVPNQDGKLSWPLGLQALLPDLEVSALRDQLDGLVQIAAKDGANGQANPQLVQQGKQAVKRLRFLLRTNGKDKFYASTYRDAARFLDNLDNGLGLLQ